MKTYEAKTIELAVENASKELNIPVTDVHYIIREEKNGILGIGKSARIDVYTLEDVYNYGIEYLKNAIKSIGIDTEITAQVNDEGIIRLTLNSERNPILIGRNGRTLRALNDLVRLAISNNFKRRYRILLDVGDYKDKKYSKIIGIARRAAKEVSRQHIDIKLDAMTSDERRMVHQVLSDFHDVTTESNGEGEKRAVVIKYVGQEEHAFQQSEVYYKDIISDRKPHGNRRDRNHRNHRDSNRNSNEVKPNNDSLNDLLHNSDSDFLKEKVEDAQPVEIREENQVKAADVTIDDLPSASIVTPIVDSSVLKDLEENKVEEPTEEKKEENK